jgi:4-amino-4-deoxy-L-arabinose transferase-like glycosyltransferase
VTGSEWRYPYPVRAIAVLGLVVLLGLLALSPGYGFHRDELYFIVVGRHPAFGYVDQPPLTPLLTAGAVQLLGLHPWAIRILPALAVVACVALAACMARDMGGTSRAQVVAALVVAVSGFLAAGHLAATATFDILAWSVVLALMTRILAGGDRRLWLLIGLAAGIGLESKHLVVFLGFALAAGLLAHRRDLLRTRGPWLALAVAVLLWAPNLAWQAANGLPQLEMAGRIAGDADENRVLLVPQLLLLAGPLLFPLALAGLVALYRNPELWRFRMLATTFLVILATMLVTGGKSYYVAGAWPPLMAAGALVADRWLGRSRPRLTMFGAATAVSLTLVAILLLPVLPAATMATTPIPKIYKESAEQVGWPELARTVDGIVGGLTPEQRAKAVILTANYGEAGALQLLGQDVPPVVSGHNSLWDLGPPPDDRTVVILVGTWQPPWMHGAFAGCQVEATIDNDVAMPNDERGQTIQVCPAMTRTWSDAWPEFRHLD